MWAEREPEFTAAGRAGMDMSDMEAMVPLGEVSIIRGFGVSDFGVWGVGCYVPESQAAPVRPISLAVENAVGILRWFDAREDGCGD